MFQIGKSLLTFQKGWLVRIPAWRVGARRSRACRLALQCLEQMPNLRAFSTKRHLGNLGSVRARTGQHQANATATLLPTSQVAGWHACHQMRFNCAPSVSLIRRPAPAAAKL